MTEPTKVTRSRLEIAEDGVTSYLEFETDEKGWMTLWHTEVAESQRGRGVGLELVKAAFEYAREHGLRVDVVCPYAQHVIAGHPELRDLVGRR